MSINRVLASGRVSYPARIIESDDGAVCVRWGFVTWGPRRNRLTGDWENFPNYLDCAMFGPRARAVSKLLKRNRQFVLDGRFQWNKWKDPHGRDLSKLQVVVLNIDDADYLSGRRASEPPLTEASIRESARSMADLPDGSVPVDTAL